MKTLFSTIKALKYQQLFFEFILFWTAMKYKPKYEILKYPFVLKTPTIEQDWKAMPFDSLSLERSGCFGSCPEFSVIFYRGGKASYNGIAYTKLKGKYSGEVWLYDYALLSSFIERVGMTGYEECYQAKWTDDETVTIKIITNGKLKEIKDYGHQAPPEFQAFVVLFEKICDKVKWNKSTK
ncbi:MAG: hypothetical protein JXC36_06355 [Candidatus Atribacteria bacterium]|nr:hypothetical protein [Candidatus Atribacteria bacterium]